jgi:hypothetical protein
MSRVVTRNERLSSEEQDRIGRQAEKLAKARAQKLESRTDYQQRARMTADDRARGAIEEFAVDLRKINEQQGKDMSFEDARKYMEKLANTADRKNDR